MMVEGTEPVSCVGGKWTVCLPFFSTLYKPSLSVPIHNVPSWSLQTDIIQLEPMILFRTDLYPIYWKPLAMAGISNTPFWKNPNHRLPKRSFIMEWIFDLSRLKVVMFNWFSVIVRLWMLYTFKPYPSVPMYISSGVARRRLLTGNSGWLA